MRIIFNGLIPIGLCLLAGCREKAPTVELPPEVSREAEFAEEEEKGLAGLPGPVYRTQLDSTINWQPWTMESFEKADGSGRMIFAVVVMPQQPSYEDALARLEENQDVVSEINEKYVPILIDGDAMREMGLLTIQLCAEIRSGLKLPLMIWMSPQGAPVAWMPLAGGNDQGSGELFRQSHVVLDRMWQEENAYIFKNSATDQKLRGERLLKQIQSEDTVDDSANVSRGCLRQLVSLYDPLSRTLDETGGLFPTGSLNFLAAGVQTEELPEHLKKMSKDVLVNLLDDLLRSAMFDPLEGSVFESRAGSDWSMPGFSKTCSGQARVAVSLFESFAATGDKRALERALGLLEFADNNYLTEEGLYEFGGHYANATEDWLWEFGEIRDLLSGEEFAAFWSAAGITEDGNIAAENDPKVRFFRKNSLRNTKGAGEVAAALGVKKDEAVALLESAKMKLLKARNKRIRTVGNPTNASASATLRMVSAFATAYRVTGDTDFRDRSENLLVLAKETFSNGRKLQSYMGDAPDSIVGGRAFLYALAIQASLDVYAVTLDETWKFWAADLVSTASELFAKDGYIKEIADGMDLIRLPLSNTTMVFEESTVGLLSMGVKRLGMLNVPVPQALKNSLKGYPKSVSSSPVLYADLGEAGLLEGYGKTYLIGENVSGKLKDAILRLPLRGAPRKITSEEPDKVRVLDAEGHITEVKDPADIEVPFLP